MLVNVRRYEEDYLAPNEKNRHGYVELRAELKAVRFNGVEFFERMPQPAYYDESENLTLRETGTPAFNVYPVGLVPYTWIEFVDIRGDEFRYSPIFYVQFKGKSKYPYSHITYYKKHDRSDRQEPYDYQFERVEVEHL
jgi:hypothetical protein